jgi:hypothetical protein
MRGTAYPYYYLKIATNTIIIKIIKDVIASKTEAEPLEELIL